MIDHNSLCVNINNKHNKKIDDNFIQKMNKLHSVKCRIKNHPITKNIKRDVRNIWKKIFENDRNDDGM